MRRFAVACRTAIAVKEAFTEARYPGAIMSDPTPEEFARQFVRRWLSDVSTAMRELGERELARIIREAIEADRKGRGRPHAA